MSKKISIKLLKSRIGRPEKQKRVVDGLGLRKINHTVIRMDTPEIRGMIRKISHLLEVEDVG